VNDAGDQYIVVKELGGGGMAVVYEATDPRTNRRVALKRPRPQDNPERDKRMQELFAREFYTLSQLAHPRIVEVYDFGVDSLGPYYTMELLDGGDLQQTVPLEWKRACAIARDVCSALSLLHSRRTVHRDISPRNIRCTLDGTAKLIDFGAMTAMGPAKDLVGTPVCCAPEALNRQPLDGRTDLYALGATLYYVLTGRHAYPVREFSALASAWSFGFARPSELVPGIPAALDALVIDLLQHDPNQRPSNAAEVMGRLAAIEGATLDEHLLVAQAYLTSPSLIGRSAELNRICERTERKRGGSTLITGRAGVGRTRLLDEVLLANKLSGAMLLRVDSQDAAEGNLGAARALTRQLFAVATGSVRAELASHARVLASLVPELINEPDAKPLPTPEVPAALRDLFISVAKTSPIVIGVDDIEQLDEPSTGLLALLARETRSVQLSLIATCEDRALQTASTALRVLADAALKVPLSDLDADQTRELLMSVFGESAELEALSQRLFAIAHGNPRDTMNLAQHLVDHRIVRYAEGAWFLPPRLDVAQLPAGVGQILEAKARELRPSAVLLAVAFALCPELGFLFEECRVLAPQSEVSELVRDIDDLLRLEVVRKTGDWLRLSDRAWIDPILARLQASDKREIHLRIAAVLGKRHDEEFRVAQHLLRAGETDRALDAFVAHAIASQAQTDVDPAAFHRLVQTLPADWEDTYDEVLRLCKERKRSKSDCMAIRRRLAGLIVIIGQKPSRVLSDLIVDLTAASGLDDWNALDPALSPAERLGAALGRAQQRYTAAPPEERGLEPRVAIAVLGRTVSDCVGFAAPRFDLEMLRNVPSLAPFAPVSASLATVQQLLEGARARLTGRTELAGRIYRAVLERLDGPDHGGLQETQRGALQALLMNSLGMFEASMGLESSLEWASKVEAFPMFRVQAFSIRFMHELWQGRVLEASRLSKKLDVLRIESGTRQVLEHAQLLGEVTAYAAMEDMTRLRRVVDQLAVIAAEHPGWRPVHAFGFAAYERLRGELAGAEAQLRETLQTIHAGDHQIWAQLAGLHVATLVDLGRLDEAVAAGTLHVTDARKAGLEFHEVYVQMPLAVAQAQLGFGEASANADAVVDRMRALSVTGVNLALAYETRARVAIDLHDQVAFDLFSTLCNDEIADTANPALSARSQRLRRAAQAKNLVTLPPQANESTGVALLDVRTMLVHCKSPEERAQAMLAHLAKQAGARDGYLYRVGGGVPQLIATIGGSKPPAAMQSIVQDYIAAETHDDEASTGDESVEGKTDWSRLTDAVYRPVLLGHYVGEKFAITGLAVFAMAADQAFAYPRDAAVELSRLSVEFGDVTSYLVTRT
jgi:Protein kinase domain/AAA ATPase domain